MTTDDIARSRVDTYTRNGLKFDVTDEGSTDGLPVVLLHGFPQTRRCWSAITPQLTDAGYRVLAPDQRGYSPGARPSGRRAYAAAELVDDVLALLDAIGAQQAHIVGHDWGAFVAWAIAAQHPDRVKTLTALSVPHPAAFSWAMPRGQLLKSWYMLAFQLPVLPERILTSERGIRALADEGLPAERARSYLADLGPEGLTAAINWYRALPINGRNGFARPVKVPTLYVWSDRDKYLGRAGAEATERFVRAPFRFEVLPGVTHWIPEQAPDRLAELLLDHFASHG